MEELRIGTRLDMGLRDYDELSRHAKLADQLGYDCVWVRDHVSLEQVTGSVDCLEAWTVMSALARDTQRVKIGSLVMCTPFRNPALLAKMGATLDVISGGRLFLGLGAGHRRDEFNEYGYDYPSNGDRIHMLAEAIQIIKLMWDEHRPSFVGEFYQIHGALNEPKPIQNPRPQILIGASKQRILRVVAEHADAWNCFDGIDVYLAARDVLADHCRSLGRDPRSIRHIVTIDTLIDPTEAGAKARLERVLTERAGQQYLRNRIIAGTPEQVADRLQPLLDLGVREFLTFHWELERQAENIEAFTTELLPLLQERVRTNKSVPLSS